MDPDANLRDQRETAAEIIRLRDTDLVPPNEAQRRIAERADLLAELVQALDEWMAAGGFPPRAWRR